MTFLRELFVIFSLTTLQGSLREARENDTLRADPVPLTAYVLIALYKIKDTSMVCNFKDFKNQKIP